MTHRVEATDIVQGAWRTTGRPTIHDWVYDLDTGLIRTHTGVIGDNESIREICKFHQRPVRRAESEKGAPHERCPADGQSRNGGGSLGYGATSPTT